MKKTAGLTASILAMCLSLAAVFPAAADVISDAPFELSVTADEPETTVAPPVSTVSAPPVQDAAAATAAETVPATAADYGSGDTVIVDTPDDSTATAGSGSTAAPTADSSTASSSGSGDTAVSADGAAASGGTIAPGSDTTASGSATDTAAPTRISTDAAAEASSGTAAVTTAAGPGASAASTGTIGPGSKLTASGTSGTGSDSSDRTPGSAYSNAPAVRVSLGYTLVSPNYDYNGYKVAEGAVQLTDGSWQHFDHNQYIRQPYYLLLREDGEWYVVAAHARRIGNKNTSDGSTVNEIWLKKSECTVQNYIDLNTTDSRRQQIVATALGYLGKGYQYAGNGPDAFDCSGFVHTVMESVGVSVPRTSSEIINAGRRIDITELRPGDIVGRVGHVGIYIGNGNFVHAAESSVGVITESIAVYNTSQPFTSYVNLLGD